MVLDDSAMSALLLVIVGATLLCIVSFSVGYDMGWDSGWDECEETHNEKG